MKNIFLWILKRFQRIIYCIYLFLSEKKSESVRNKIGDIFLWINPGFSRRDFVAYWGNNTFVWDIVRWITLKKMGYKVNIIFGKRIGKLKNSKIVLSCSSQSNIFNFINYSESLDFIAKQLESQGNTLFPSRAELRFWENKSHMYREFSRLRLSHPRTIVSTFENAKKNCDLIGYPLIIKEEHSCSSKGIYLVKSVQELHDITEKGDFREKNSHLIIQEFIDIRRDLRVIVVGDEVVLHYWRINKGNTWRPTATGRGNRVDFNNFPEQWRYWIVDVTSKLGLTSAAYDIAWYNDDTTNTPLILEVSPSFEPNPKILNSKICENYGAYKKGFSLFKSYDIAFVDISHQIQSKWLRYTLKESSNSMTAFS